VEATDCGELGSSSFTGLLDCLIASFSAVFFASFFALLVFIALMNPIVFRYFYDAMQLWQLEMEWTEVNLRGFVFELIKELELSLYSCSLFTLVRNL
jgi:hypothetical protein